MKSSCNSNLTDSCDVKVFDFAEQIILEYQKQGVEMNCQELMLSCYIQQITGLENINDRVTNGILQAARICKNSQDFNSEGEPIKIGWKEIEKELKDKKIDIRTIAIVSNVYRQGENKEVMNEL